MSRLSRVISIVVFIAIAVALALWVRSRMPESNVGEAFKTCALFRDGTRLAVGSPVLIAGVRVGEISRLTVEGAFARIDMTLQDDVRIPADSWITKRAFSPFGDSYIEIIPTVSAEGAAPALTLKSGQCLMRVLEGNSTDRTLRLLYNVMPSVDRGLERLHQVASYGRKWSLGTLEEGALNAERWLEEGRIEGPLDKAEQAMARLEAATTGAAESVANAKPRVNDGFDRVEDGVAKARRRMAELKVSLHDGMQRMVEGMDGLDKPADDFAELVAAVNEGRGDDYKGQLGRMINDPRLADSIEEGTESAKEGIGSFNRFKSWLGLRTEFNIGSRTPKFYVTAEVRARTDKFYLVELQKSTQGDFPDDQLTSQIGTDVWHRQQVIRDRLRFTAQFGKTFGNWFQIRGGLKESTFGFGADMLLRNGRLKFSGDVFGSHTYTPRVKLAGALEVFRSIYLIAGIDDVLNEPVTLQINPGNSDVPILFDEIHYGRDYFLGAALQFDDADLALLLRLYGALLVGLL